MKVDKKTFQMCVWFNLFQVIVYIQKNLTGKDFQFRNVYRNVSKQDQGFSSKKCQTHAKKSPKIQVVKV